MSRYLRCTSCKQVLDTETKTVVLGTALKKESAASSAFEKQLQKAVDESEDYVCYACEFIASKMPNPRPAPPDPSTYEKLGGRG